MAKEIKYDMDARDLLKKGVDELANAVKVTLGFSQSLMFSPTVFPVTVMQSVCRSPFLSSSCITA